MKYRVVFKIKGYCPTTMVQFEDEEENSSLLNEFFDTGCADDAIIGNCLKIKDAKKGGFNITIKGEPHEEIDNEMWLMVYERLMSWSDYFSIQFHKSSEVLFYIGDKLDSVEKIG